MDTVPIVSEFCSPTLVKAVDPDAPVIVVPNVLFTLFAVIVNVCADIVTDPLSHCKEINRTFAKKIANEKSRFIKREIQNV